MSTDYTNTYEMIFLSLSIICIYRNYSLICEIFYGHVLEEKGREAQKCIDPLTYLSQGIQMLNEMSKKQLKTLTSGP
jgi:hypothetical protein